MIDDDYTLAPIFSDDLQPLTRFGSALVAQASMCRRDAVRVHGVGQLGFSTSQLSFWFLIFVEHY
jgi:hypothetical protein